MIKRTPQEIADFFDCYVVQDGSTGVFKAYSEKPEFVMEDPEFGIENVWIGKDGESAYIAGLVDVPKNHDFHILYEPSKPKDKALHQSEVHTHKEYIIVGGCNNRISLEKDIGNNINNGWKLLGGVAVDDGLFYQAMVRGV